MPPMHLAFLDDNILHQFHPLQLYTQSRCHIKLLNVPQQIQLVHIRMKYNRAFHLVLVKSCTSGPIQGSGVFPALCQPTA